MSCPFVGEKKKRELKQILNNDRVILYVKIYLLHLLYNYFLCVVVVVLVFFFFSHNTGGVPPFLFPLSCQNIQGSQQLGMTRCWIFLS